jgi:hypothetical protein
MLLRGEEPLLLMLVAEAPALPVIDVAEFRRRWRERERAARLEQLWRDNSATPLFTRPPLFR